MERIKIEIVRAYCTSAEIFYKEADGCLASKILNYDRFFDRTEDAENWLKDKIENMGFEYDSDKLIDVFHHLKIMCTE